MDANTQQMVITVGAGIAKKLLIGAGASLVTHGVITSNQTEAFVSAGMVAVGIAWSLWQDYGKAIILSQLEVMKAKSQAQAEKMRMANIKPVTLDQIAMQSPKMNTAEVAKVAATLPVAIQVNIAPTAKT